MKQLNEDIKTGQLKKVYLLWGQEAYLRKQYRDRLRSALAGEDTMNCHYFQGKDTDTGEIIDLAETLPFLAPRRVIIVEDSGLFKKGGEALAEYLERAADAAYFVFIEEEVDKRSRLYKAVKETGRITEFSVQDENTLCRWIAGMAAREKKGITEHSIRYFLEKTGTDMANIRMELEKLFCYTADRNTITEEDIDKICTRKVSNQIFDMISALAEKKQKKALALYYDLLALKEPPMRILFLIGRQFNLLMQVKECRKKGYDNRTIAGKTGLRDFLVGKYAAQASRFPTDGLKKAVNACVETEEKVKTGRINDVLGVELLIIEYSQ
ncbi:MAG: DNA polymerase III subunit delta [Lachnospiraceae bacterium]|jgi:DNA polymerase-3 subunit delta|nr:DNA polymerase III subunit delta [Lachnospiraceae bacterium]